MKRAFLIISSIMVSIPCFAVTSGSTKCVADEVTANRKSGVVTLTCNNGELSGGFAVDSALLLSSIITAKANHQLFDVTLDEHTNVESITIR